MQPAWQGEKKKKLPTSEQTGEKRVESQAQSLLHVCRSWRLRSRKTQVNLCHTREAGNEFVHQENCNINSYIGLQVSWW